MFNYRWVSQGQEATVVDFQIFAFADSMSNEALYICTRFIVYLVYNIPTASPCHYSAPVCLVGFLSSGLGHGVCVCSCEVRVLSLLAIL